MSKPRPAHAKAFRPKPVKSGISKRQLGVPDGPVNELVRNRVELYMRRLERGEPLYQGDPPVCETPREASDVLLAESSSLTGASHSLER